MNYPEIKIFEYNPSMAGMARLVPNVKYSEVNGGLYMTLIVPWGMQAGGKYPLVVFVQGSSWTTPDINYEIPQLSQLARQGYVVATIVHRSAVEGNPWPAYLVDTKCAIRFLRAHAAEYGIDPERVCIYGTSSGGNTALLVGVTGDDDRFRSTEYAEQSDAVKVVVDCFGPADLPKMIDLDPEKASEGGKALIYGLAGEREPEELLELMSPVNYVEAGKKYPPFMLLNGDADNVVPYEQSEIMFRKLIDCGCEARLIRVKGAEHEGNFWSPALVDEIFGFIKERL